MEGRETGMRPGPGARRRGNPWLAGVALLLALVLSANLAMNLRKAPGPPEAGHHGMLRSAGAAAPRTADTPAPTPAQEIERLIRHVAALDSAVFLRDGGAYGAAEAAAQLRRELAQAGQQVRTAEEFIQLCVSRPSLSAGPFRVRFADGGTRALSDVLREFLAGMRAAP
jgi:hypothetical protein